MIRGGFQIMIAIIMFFVAIPIWIVGIKIFKGKTDLIHDYHQTRVKDKINYGKAMGKAIIGIGIVIFISGLITIIPDLLEDTMISICLSMFFVGFIICMIWIYKIQKKYNGGVF